MKISKVFYGWWIVGASFLIALYLGGVVLYGFTTVFEPIADEFGWSYTQVALAASLRGMEIGLFAPLAGVFADRWGPRRLLFGGILCTALGLITLSRTNSLAMFYGSFIIVSAGMSASTQTILTTAVANWFRRRMGLAIGIAVSGFGAGGLLIPIMVKLIDDHGWRTSLNILAVGMMLFILPLSLLFRHKPEHYGYTPDGIIESSADPSQGSVPPPPNIAEITGKQALKGRNFWHLAVAYTFYFMATSAVIAHVMPYLGSIGITRRLSGLVATLIPLISMPGRLGFGWLGDKLNKKYMAVVTFALSALGLFCFGFTPNGGSWLLVFFLIFFGLGYGGNNVMRSSLVREIYGRRSFGAVFGFLVGINMLGGIAGPLLAGVVFDQMGSYQSIWYTYSGLAVVAMLAVLTIRFTGSSPIQNTG